MTTQPPDTKVQSETLEQTAERIVLEVAANPELVSYPDAGDRQLWHERLKNSRRVHELDNHHNALACGYCAGPLRDELLSLQSQLEQLRAKLAQVEQERNALRSIADDALRFRVEMNGSCNHEEYMTKLCTQCEIRAALEKL